MRQVAVHTADGAVSTHVEPGLVLGLHHMARRTEQRGFGPGDELGWSEADKNAIEEETANLRTAMKTDDKAAIDTAVERLQKVSYKLAEEMYRQKEAGPQPGPTGSADAKKEDPGKKVDADYTVIDDDKR